ncbi:Tn3 family transposase, partial [Streptomyces inhibens]
MRDAREATGRSPAATQRPGRNHPDEGNTEQKAADPGRITRRRKPQYPRAGLRYLSDAPLRRRVTAATNKVEAFNGFSQWIGFGNGGVITDNDPVEQEKTAKFNALLTNAVIFHNALDIAEIVRRLQEEG